MTRVKTFIAAIFRIFLFLDICLIVFSTYQSDKILDAGKNRNALNRSMKQPSTKKEQIKWTPQLQSVLKKLFRETNTSRYGHSSRIKAKWDLLYPEYTHLRPKYLKDSAATFIRNEEQQYRGRKRKMVGWTEKMNKDLLEIFHRNPLPSGERGPKIYQEWVQMYPDYRDIGPDMLLQRACGLKRGKYKIVRGEDSGGQFDLTKKYFKWSKEMKDHLRRIHDETPSGPGRVGIIFNKWKEKYPKYAFFAPSHVYQQARLAVQRRKPNEILQNSNSGIPEQQ